MYHTAAELLQLWHSRDDLYAARGHYQRRAFVPSLDAAAVAAIRDNRRREVDLLPAEERATAWSVLQTWTPPVPFR